MKPYVIGCEKKPSSECWPEPTDQAPCTGDRIYMTLPTCTYTGKAITLEDKKCEGIYL